MTAFRKPLSGFLAFILVFAFVAVTPIVAFAEDEVIEFSKEEIELNKKESDGFEYVRTSDGTAAILVGYVGSETEVKIPSSIDSLKVIEIADEAFMNNTKITKVTATNNITKIGDRVFMGCTALKEVKAIKSVTAMGEAVFEGCTSLTDVTIPDTVVNIPARTFYGCTALLEVEAHKNLKSVSPSALTDTAWEKSQPDGALSFGRVCYGYKGDITNLVIPEGVSIIESYAFLGCEQIKTVEFGEDVEEIGLYAFQNCVNLEKMVCSSAVSVIKAGAFKGCASLKEADFSECTISAIGYESFAGCKSLASVKLHETLSEIGAKAFQDTSVKTLELGKNVNSVGKDVVLGNKAFEGFEVSSKNKEYSAVDGVLYNKDGGSLILYPAAKAGTFELPQSVSEIREGAFKNASVSEIKIPQDSALNTIGNNAFEGSAVKAISLPENVTIINSEVFKNAANLKTVELGSNVTKISKSAFEGTKALTEISLPDTVRDISAYAFKNSGLVTVNIGNGVVRIGTEAFADNATLKEVVLGENLEKLGEGAFMNCVALAKINLPANVNDFDMTAFKGCKALKKIAVANDNANYKVAAGAIYSMDGKTLVAVANNTLKELKIADGTEVIAANAFDLATGISSITFPATLVNVKAGALDVTGWFKSKSAGAVYAGPVLYKVIGNGADLKIADKTTAIADNAVNNAAVKNVTIPATVKVIGAYAFANSGIVEIVIPNSVTTIGNNAFENAKALKKVTLSNALETMGKALFKNCASLASIKIPATIKNLPVDTFLNCAALAKVDLGSVETIGKYAFSNCAGLITITLPATLTELDPMSFYGCKALEAVNVAEGNAKFKSVEGVVIAADEDSVFNTIALYPAGKQGAYTIPNDIKFIADRAFYDCDNLTEVKFPASVERIGVESFFDCDAIIAVALSAGTEHIGDYAFASCNELRSFKVESNLTEYSENVFDGCYYFNYELVDITVKESSAVFIIAVALVFVVICVIWYFSYQKKQVKLEKEIKEKIEERELLEKARKIKEEQEANQ